MMSARADLMPSVVDRIKTTLVGLRMPWALEIVDVIVRQLERGEVSALEAIDAMLAEEFTLRESSRIKTSLVMARLSNIKTLAGFDFTFHPPLAFHVLRTRNLGQLRPRSIATGSSLWRN